MQINEGRLESREEAEHAQSRLSKEEKAGEADRAYQAVHHVGNGPCVGGREDLGEVEQSPEAAEEKEVTKPGEGVADPVHVLILEQIQVGLLGAVLVRVASLTHGCAAAVRSERKGQVCVFCAL